MKTVAALDIEGHLASLLDQIEQGEEVTITRAGKAVARLVPIAGAATSATAGHAADGLRALSAGLHLDGLSIRDLIAEGRR